MCIIFKRIGKVIGSIICAPIWLALKALSVAFWAAEKVTNFGLVRLALCVVMGFAVLGSLVGGSWDAVLILGLPAGFLYIFPYISQYVRGGCLFLRDLITHGVWGLPEIDGD